MKLSETTKKFVPIIAFLCSKGSNDITGKVFAVGGTLC